MFVPITHATKNVPSNYTCKFTVDLCKIREVGLSSQIYFNFFWQYDARLFSGPDDATTGGCDGQTVVKMLI